MKVITLNTWGARAGHKEFLQFIQEKSESVDVFCLQEVWNVTDTSGSEVISQLKGAVVGGVVLNNMFENLFPELSNILENFNGFFRPHYGDHYGLAIFIKKDLQLLEEGDVFVFKDKEYVPNGDIGNHARNIQYATINTENGPLTIINFHGLWNGKGKTDTEDRLLQSDNIIKFLNTLKNPYILCGDFNLLPDTLSLKKFENFGLKNLIKDFGVTSTRTSLYKKEHRFADYIFTSPEVEVLDFKVLPDEVSDHSPLLLDFK